MPARIISSAGRSTATRRRTVCLRARPPPRWPRWRAILRRAASLIKVFDCYRPVRAVANFVRWARDLNDQKMKAEFYPNVDKRTLFRDGYIASHSGHSRGSTMDLTLAKTDGTELDMGTPFRFLQSEIMDRRSDDHAGAARQPHAARRRDAPPRLSRLRQGVVALHAARRAVPGDLFRFSGEVSCHHPLAGPAR